MLFYILCFANLRIINCFNYSRRKTLTLYTYLECCCCVQASTE